MEKSYTQSTVLLYCGRGIGGQTSTQILARFTADGCHKCTLTRQNLPKIQPSYPKRGSSIYRAFFAICNCYRENCNFYRENSCFYVIDL